jgi:hypothetical protein
MAKPGQAMKTVKGPGIFLAQFVDTNPLSIVLMEFVNGLLILDIKEFKFPPGKPF